MRITDDYRKSVFVCLLTLVCVFTLFAQTPNSTVPRADPCASRPEYKQFDFWIGEWEVKSGERTVGTSSIQKIVGGCIIFENYSQADGYQGKSLNFFDASLGKWRQTWVDRMGNVSEFSGEFKDTAMHLEGETHRADGTKILRRMTLFNLGPERVRQYSERSVDDGKTWSIAYDFTYFRKR